MSAAPSEKAGGTMKRIILDIQSGLYARTIQRMLLQELEDDAIQMDTEKYIGWKQGAAQITLREDNVRVERTGSLLFPFAGIVPGEIDREWKTQRSFENRRIFPVAFLRSLRKLAGGK